MTDQTKDKKHFEPSEHGLNSDRVVYGASRKVSDGNYGSYDFHCSLSTDVRPGESHTEAIKRAVGFVEKVVGFKVQQGMNNKLKY